MLEVIPCAPGAHIGEVNTLGFLREELLGDHLILTNRHLPDEGGTLEIDLVVLNYNGVFLLGVQHWWGKTEDDQIHWLQSGHEHPSPLTRIELKAKRVHSTLTAVLSKGDTLLPSMTA